jgi:hypothetical protein
MPSPKFYLPLKYKRPGKAECCRLPLQIGTPHPATSLSPVLLIGVGSKLKCPVLVASEMSGFKVVPSPVGSGWFWGWGAGEGGSFPFPCLVLY